MKTKNIITAMFIAIVVLTQSCEDDFNRINGEGSITTETLSVAEFTGFQLTGADNVHVSYGPVQKVEVTGHPNIISRIEKKVINDVWYIELEDGNYGRYELTYNLTLPYLERVVSIGTGNIYMEGSFNQDNIYIRLEGTSNFQGFSMVAETCAVDIIGSGNCELTATGSLDVDLNGSGHVYYRGKPSLRVEITGSGSIVDAN